ncbi:FUSC family protein [Prauserella sp. PE36]|uniref:FUSC family protein n=1 Tax=Prauserella sp. PE36 TaxID=1504709 RepID=UPI000DE2CC2C|nr:FUSC family protein [Prauserella sp. PE36]RBM20916.1 FUSC family protein [Prauserella sp. PE36]
MIATALDRLRASDPGLVWVRSAASAVLGIGIAAGALVALGQPLTVVLVGAIAAMMSAFTVTDPEPGQQAVTLVLGFAVGAAALTAASLGQAAPPLDGIVFVLLIFVAVYAQRFGPRGIALGSLAFFLFFFAMFLQTRVGQVPVLLLALAVGLGANTLVRFAFLPRRPERELLSVRRAFRARLGAVVRAAIAHLASGGSARSDKQLRRAGDRLHECVLLIEDTAEDVIDPAAAALLRRRAIEVELAVQWLTITTRRTCADTLDEAVRDDLLARLRRLGTLIERDPRELPVISETDEFSKLLVEGSRLSDQPRPGDELRRAMAELALADVNAQRIAERDYSAETEPPEPEEPERTRVFAWDNRTRSALQAVIGGGLAVVGGELVSPQRWYWAVLTVFVVFVGTSSAGATLVKGARRFAGTLVGIFAGALCALLVTGSTTATIVLILVCVFGTAFVARVSQTAMAFFITTMLGLLYSLLGTFSLEVLGVRLAETAVGALAGVLAAVVIVPVRTRSVLLEDVAAALEDLREFVVQADALLTGRENVNVIELSRQLDRAVERLRATVEPLTHPINLRGARRDYGWYVLNTLEAIAFRARNIAARAQPGLLALDGRLPALIERLTGNIDVLLEVVGGGTEQRALAEAGGAPPGDLADSAQARTVLSSLGKLDEALLALGRAFDVETSAAQSVQVRRRTHPSGAAADNIPDTRTEPVSRRTL